ncbi:hypothetical protein MMC11_008667, partial [Xylographa trunciseda]|nr:hypothetical protein [Xylographa trunciseda]
MSKQQGKKHMLLQEESAENLEAERLEEFEAGEAADTCVNRRPTAKIVLGLCKWKAPSELYTPAKVSYSMATTVVQELESAEEDSIRFMAVNIIASVLEQKLKAKSTNTKNLVRGLQNLVAEAQNLFESRRSNMVPLYDVRAGSKQYLAQNMGASVPKQLCAGARSIKLERYSPDEQLKPRPLHISIQLNK